MKNCTPEKLANKWIRQMQKANFTPDQMLECLKLADEKYKAFVYTKTRFKKLHEIATLPSFDKAIVHYQRRTEKSARFNSPYCTSSKI